MKYKHSCLALATLVTLSSAAFAQDIQGAVQLGLGTGLITYNKDTVKQDVIGGGHVDIDYARTNWGFHGTSGVVFEGGYGLTDSLVLGGLLALGNDSTEVSTGNNEDTVSTFELLLAPKIDYLFMPASKVRPFVGGALGLVVHNTDYDDGDTETSLLGVGLLARAGIRWFAAPGFSIDPALNFGGRWLSGDTDTGNLSYDASSSGYQIGLSLGMSGWIK
jgi:hypothetical protein